MNAIVRFFQTIVIAIFLACSMFVGSFIYLAYNAPETLTEIHCALKTDGVIANSACIHYASFDS